MWDDYKRFHRLSLETGDVDPVYPVLRHVADQLHLSGEDRIRLVVRHVAFYHLGSSLASFATGGWDFPCGTERRGHRDPKQRYAHLRAVEEIESAPGGWGRVFAPAFASADPRMNWRQLTAALGAVHGNGRWASFKTAEMLWKVCGLPVEAPDMGHAYSSGPRHGLKLLFPQAPDGNSAADVAELDRLSGQLCARLEAAGLSAPVEEAETTLCDFHALVEGRYYVGHDWDNMLRELRQVPGPLTIDAFRAREAAGDPRVLGEVNGWTSVRKPLKKLYRETGRLEWWA